MTIRERAVLLNAGNMHPVCGARTFRQVDNYVVQELVMLRAFQDQTPGKSRKLCYRI